MDAMQDFVSRAFLDTKNINGRNNMWKKTFTSNVKDFVILALAAAMILASVLIVQANDLNLL